MSAADRRAMILDAAMEAFAMRGYHGASRDDVAATAGVSKALIYEHFSSKQNLHDTLISAQAGELFGRLAAAADPELAPDQRLRGGVDMFFGFVEERREAWRALFRDAADPELAPLIDRLQGQAARAIVALVPAGGAGVSEQDVEMYAQLTSGACQALANWWAEHPEVPREELVDRVIAFCWDGMSRLPTT